MALYAHVLGLSAPAYLPVLRLAAVLAPLLLLYDPARAPGVVSTLVAMVACQLSQRSCLRARWLSAEAVDINDKLEAKGHTN